MSLSVQVDDYNAPTNPQLTSTTADFSDGDRIYTAITSHGGVSLSVSGWGGTVAEYSNLHTTKGFRIKCYDALTTDGIRFNPTAQNLIDNDYFVLLYSDTPFQHHFAKITEVITEDIEGDAFEFSPKLGNEIPKGTKFAIFQMGKDDDVIAVSLGLLQDSTPTDYIDQLARRMVVARPLFYFYPGLDKKDELNHNVKYYAMRECGTANSYTLDNTDPAITFITRQDFGKTITDYSKYSHRVVLTDVLRTLDETNTATNEGSTGLSSDTTDYDATYRNARRIADDIITTPTYTGPSRYLHYDFSPLKANVAYNVYEHTHTESIEGKGGFAETSIIDSARIMPKKVKEFAEYRVRQDVHRGELNAFFSVKATYASKNSAYAFVFAIEYDLRDVLNDGDEVKCGSDFYLVDTVAAPSGKTQQITFKNFLGNVLSRTATEAEFTAKASKTPTVGDVLERRAYSAQDNTLMLDTHLLNDRFSKLYVAFSSLNLNERFASVTASDATIGMITLSFSDDAYSGNPLSYTDGNYVLYIERFNGEVENIESRKEDNQTIMSIQGRDKFSKLLSPVVNLNTLFSEDIIYSTQSPYNKLVLMDGNNFSIAIGDTSLATGLTFSQFTNLPAVGDHLFTANGYIGVVTSRSVNGSLEYTLTFSRGALTEANSEQIYVSKEKNYVFNKALSSSHLATNKPTSLTGSANKGIFFTAGNETNSDGTEGNSLVGSSVNTSDGAIGYSINKPSSVSNDFAFQTKLHDEYGSADPASFDTVNSLIDFEVVSTTKKDNVTEIELAPYIPVTLGRKIDTHIETSEYTFTSIGPVSTVDTATNDKYFQTTNTAAYSLNMGDPIFVGSSKTFVGNVLSISITTTTSANTWVMLDRTLYNFTVGDEVYVGTSPITNIGFVNGAHLWGGKVVTLPHLTYKVDEVDSSTTYGLVPFNVENTTTSADYSKKYGQMYYKTHGIGFGAFSLNQPITKFTSETFPKFYPTTSKINYLTSNYNFKPNTASDNKINFGQTDTYRTLPIEIRGTTSVFGSNISVSRIHRDEYINLPLRNSTGDIGLLYALSKFQNFDESAARLFLYITSDLLPYSSLREDSLMDGNKSINNYNLFLIENKKISDSSISGGNRLSLRDNNFQSLNFSADIDIASLRRFGIMRLTEVCYDSFFNPVNPEKVIQSKYGTKISLGFNSYEIDTLGAITVTGNILTITASISLSNGDTICDNFGNFIGLIDSGSGTTYTLQSAGYLTNAGASANYGIRVTTSSETIYMEGRNEKDSLYQIEKDAIHPLKSAVVPEDSNLGKGTADKIYVANSNSAVSVTDQEVYLAFGISAGVGNNGVSIIENDDSFPLKTILDVCKNKRTHQGLVGVSLDRYDIENGGLYPLVEGNTTQVLRNNAPVAVGHDRLSLLTSDHHFKEFTHVGDSSASSPSAAGDSEKAADGSYMVFKPRLRVKTAKLTTDTIKSSSGDLKNNKIDIQPSSGEYDNGFLQFVDLTGCYLASEVGEDIDGTLVTAGGEFQRRSMKDVIPTELIYIYSHEVSDSDVHEHHLITDSALTANRAYRVLQPNETCFYNFMPKDIYLNMLSPRYTKKANSNNTYNINKDYFFTRGIDKTGNNNTLDEGILSMFVAVDTDKQNSESRMVIAGPDDFFDSILPEENYGLYFSDGENGKKISVNVTKNSAGNQSMVLSDMLTLNGIVSVSETFTASSNQELKINPTRACIGSTVSIGLEGEDLINELLEQEGIEFETTGTDIPLYLAPNYQGVDLYSAIRYVLDRKEMKLVEENDVFKIVPDDEDAYYTNITIDDSGDYLIQDFEKVSTLFDFYNEIIVYGNAHKTTRKDIRSIQKRGRKTLEVVDGSLLTQEEVDKQAQKLLRIHSSLNQKLTLTMSSKGINQLRPGDIINVEITRENIEMSQYIVLQMEHNITGFMKLELGRYSKDLSDVFAELLVSSKQTKAALRSNDLASNEISYNFLNTLDTKELKLLVRKRASSGGATLGFGTELGFEAELGFEGGATITITDLLEEDLA